MTSNRLATALVFGLTLLAACSEEPRSRVDTAEVRTLAEPISIGDSVVAGRIAVTLGTLVAATHETTKLADVEVVSGGAAFVRVGMLNNETAGSHKFVDARLLFGPDLSGGTGSGTARLCFRARGEDAWQVAPVSSDATRQALAEIGDATKRDLLLVAGLTISQADAARRGIAQVAVTSGVFGSEIALVKVENVEWPNAALGLPQPGMAYAEMIVPGHRVTLRLPGNRTVVCHTSDDRVLIAP